MFIERQITSKIKQLADKFPVITLTGARQCGKSTLLRHSFPEYQYASLEDLDLRKMANEDPRGFLQNYQNKTIIDEAQYAPDLFSYIQTRVDDVNETGMYILSGSHNFLLMERITQSLAGRAGILKLTPFSIEELKKADKLPEDLNNWLFTGGYPRIYDKNIHPTDFFPSYIQTYLERDVRLLRNISDLSLFVRFLKLCAARIGQLLHISNLANECGINVNTAQAWISILEASYTIYQLKPYYKNFNKRLIKSSKLYFFDTGLAASLLGIENSQQLFTHYLRGELFENMIINEYIKSAYALGKEPQMYFWRDSNHNEIDLLIEKGTQLQAVEIKSAATLNSSFTDVLQKFKSIAGVSDDNLTVVYGGDMNFGTAKGKFISWKNWPHF